MVDRSSHVQLKLHLRHVGLGNAILLELPDDRCAVVDWGTTDSRHHQYLERIVGNREVAFVLADKISLGGGLALSH